MNIAKGEAIKFITIYDNFKDGSFHVETLGVNVLYKIATLPEEERKKEHVTSKGEVKQPIEMTARELKNLFVPK